MKRINNSQVRGYVQNRKEFKNNTGSVYGYMAQSVPQNTARYIVCSYGGHYPLFIYEWMPDSPVEGVWYENASWFSTMTRKHHTLAHPHTACTPMGIRDMQLIADGGLVYMMEHTAKY